MNRALIAALLLLLSLPAAAAEPYRRLELGLGLLGGWSVLEEADGPGKTFELADDVAPGPVGGIGWRLTETVLVDLEIAGGRHDTSLDGVDAFTTTALVGLRVEPRRLRFGGLRPWLRGAFGGAQSVIGAEGGGEDLKLDGIVGLFGLGARLAVSPRLQFDLELNHGLINYEDGAVVIENVYTGNRMNKAGRVTRLQLVARWLI